MDSTVLSVTDFAQILSSNPDAAVREYERVVDLLEDAEDVVHHLFVMFAGALDSATILAEALGDSPGACYQALSAAAHIVLRIDSMRVDTILKRALPRLGDAEVRIEEIRQSARSAAAELKKRK